jgi:hypothetical protein
MYILPEHLNSPLAFGGVCFAQSLVLFCILLIIACNLTVLWKVQEKIEALTLEIEECIPCNIRGSITRASFEHLSSPPVFSGVRVTLSLVLCVCFVDRCLSFCPFSFGELSVLCQSTIKM